MQKADASVIPVQWSVSWGVASKAEGPLSCHHDIRERIGGLENRLFAKMNQRPKLGREG